jgi:hypothetical protein
VRSQTDLVNILRSARQRYPKPLEQRERFGAQELTADLVLRRSVAFDQDNLPAPPSQVKSGSSRRGAAPENEDIGSDVRSFRLQLAALLDLYGPDLVVYGDLVHEGGLARANDVFDKCTEEAEAAFHRAGGS